MSDGSLAAPKPAPLALRSEPQARLQRCGGTACPAGTCGHDDEPMVARLTSGPAPARTPALVDQVLATAGRPLSAGVRSTMEARFGHDFSRVRVHADEAAARSADAVHAFAWTVGSHVAFGAGRYAPETSAGSRLLAHELTHVVQQRAVGDMGSVGEPRPAGSSVATGPVPFQAKLSVSEPGDADEEEADEVARLVAGGMSDAYASRTGGPARGASLMRKGIDGGSCDAAPSTGIEDEEEAEQIQRRALHQGGPAGVGGIGTAIARTRGGGSRLSTGVRSLMEARLGARFDDVRIHTDGHAARMSAAVDAAAFTSRRDIYFGAGRYAPDSQAGRELLAHELVHVVQRRAGRRSTRGQVSDPELIQRYRLRGFPPDKARRMHDSIAIAKTTVANCDYLTWMGQYDVVSAIDRSRFDYVPDLGLCGWTFPSSWYIEIGEKAFDKNRCCLLSSTIAHEAAHVRWRTEGAAGRLECNCFACSC